MINGCVKLDSYCSCKNMVCRRSVSKDYIVGFSCDLFCCEFSYCFDWYCCWKFNLNNVIGFGKMIGSYINSYYDCVVIFLVS